MSHIIEVENLKKNYGAVEAVKGIDFYVEKGTMFAFLGQNGAGKSTTIDILCTLSQPNSGNVIIDGHILGKEDDDIRKKIGVVFQDSVLDSLLTVRENLTTRAHFYNMTKQEIKEAIAHVSDATDIADFIDRPYGKLSGGQRRRADIARALIHTPKILFLDEPTTGLDPKTKESVWKTIYSLQKKAGMTVFLTTHYMEETTAADYIVILDKGTISAKGTPYDLQAKFTSDRIRIKSHDPESLIALLKKDSIPYIIKQGLIMIDLETTLDALPILEKARPFIDNFEVIHGSMEDAFLSILGGTTYA